MLDDLNDIEGCQEVLKLQCVCGRINQGQCSLGRVRAANNHHH